MRKSFIPIAAVSTLLLAACSSTSTDEAPASNYPNQRIQVIVPWAPGGGTDQMTRAIVASAEQVCNWDISVTNLEGGGGAAGHQAIADAKADGYTIGTADSSYMLYKPAGVLELEPDAYAAIMQFNTQSSVFAIDSSLPYKSLGEWVEAAKTTRMAIGINALGGYNHIASLGMLKGAGIEADFVQYPKGAAQQIQGMLAGEIDGVLSGAGEMVPFVENGNLTPLGVTTDERALALPDVPTFQEEGIDFSMSLWRGLVAPAGIPADVQSALETCFVKAAQDDSFLTFMSNNSFVPESNGSADFMATMEADFVNAAELYELVD